MFGGKKITILEGELKDLQKQVIESNEKVRNLMERVIKAELIAENAEAQLRELNLTIKIDRQEKQVNLTKKWLNGEYDEKDVK